MDGPLLAAGHLLVGDVRGDRLAFWGRIRNPSLEDPGLIWRFALGKINMPSLLVL